MPPPAQSAPSTELNPGLALGARLAAPARLSLPSARLDPGLAVDKAGGRAAGGFGGAAGPVQ
eukprot:9762126-Lingulodinium_polyedra.AAC.1